MSENRASDSFADVSELIYWIYATIINKSMQQMRAFKFRLYPSDEQSQVLAQIFGSKRWIYNHFLQMQKELYANEKKHLSHFDMNNLITDLKKQDDTSWLRQGDSIALQAATEDLATAYTNFFKSITGKRKGKKMEVPRFKKKSNQQSYRTRGVKILDGAVKLPKIKIPVKCVLHQEIPPGSKIKSCTISKTPSGKYFVSVLTETQIDLKSMSSKEVGIDLGLTHVAITSDGHKFDHPKHQIAKTKRLLKKGQRQLSYKTKGSKNYERKRVKVAKLYEKITNIRKNYYHNISNYLVTNYDAIYVEDLNVTGMIKNRKLSRAIHESSWAQLSTMIEYKANWYGKTYYRINRWAPTSKTCSCCGHKADVMPLSVRNWVCPSCEQSHDRDINAATNILHMGQIDLYGKLISYATGERAPVPTALMKHTSKTERPSELLVGVGIEQAQRLRTLCS